jgi:hypothetical protein
MLVYYEIHSNVECAITREKQNKGGLRKKKLRLIEDMNPNWHDLYLWYYLNFWMAPPQKARLAMMNSNSLRISQKVC